MAVVRWDPFSVLSRMDADFDDLVRRTWGPTGGATGYVPAIDLVRDGADVLITFELPGVDIDSDVEIEVTPGRLVVSGERRGAEQHEDSEARLLVRELRYGSFRREFALPEHVTAEDVEAHYDRGLLSVRVHEVTKPKPEPVKIAVRKRQQAVETQVEDSTDSGKAKAVTGTEQKG